MVIWEPPDTDWYVAKMSTSPAATPVTRPAALTEAMPVLDDVHTACAVTVCVVAFDSVAIAVNCEVVPTTGAAPETATDCTVNAGVVLGAIEELLPHAHRPPASIPEAPKAT